MSRTSLGPSVTGGRLLDIFIFRFETGSTTSPHELSKNF